MGAEDAWTDLTAPMAASLGGRTLRCTWVRGEPAAKFQISSRELAEICRWSADGSRLWTASSRGGKWSEWDPLTGKRLRRAAHPDNLARPLLSKEKGETLAGRRRDGRPLRRILACSPDLERAVTGHYPDGGPFELRSTSDGQVIATITHATEPFAFSADGQRVVGDASGELGLAVVSAKDATLLVKLPFDETLAPFDSMSWAPGGELLIATGARERSRLLCYSVDHQRPLWTTPGSFRRTHVDRDGKHAAGLTDDYAVVIWDLATGALVREIPRGECVQGPLLSGEPDIQAFIERLRTNPVRWSIAAPVSSLRVFAGGKKLAVTLDGLDGRPHEVVLGAEEGEQRPVEPLPWRPMDAAERAAAVRALPAGISVGSQIVAADGSFVVWTLAENIREIPDPDAGSVYELDASLGLWDRRNGRWVWRTSAEPNGYTLKYLCESGGLTLSWDESGIFAGPPSPYASRALYDVATGELREARTGDDPPKPEGPSADARVLAADRTRRWVLVAHRSTVELWDLRSNERVDTIDLSTIDEVPSAAAFLGEDRALVVGTEKGRVLRLQ